MCDSAVGMEPYFPAILHLSARHILPLFPSWIRFSLFPSSLDKIPPGLLPPTISHQQSNLFSILLRWNMKKKKVLSRYLVLVPKQVHLTLCQCEPNLLHFLPLALSNIWLTLAEVVLRCIFANICPRISHFGYFGIFAPKFLIFTFSDIWAIISHFVNNLMCNVKYNRLKCLCCRDANDDMGRSR